MAGKYYVWVDIESTGLQFDGTDEILEIAAVLTDTDYKQVGEPYSAVVQPTSEWLDKMNDYVRNMHKENGLIDDIVSKWGSLPSPSKVDNELVMWLLDQLGYLYEREETYWGTVRSYRTYDPEEMLVLSGASVAADEKWMRYGTPKFFSKLYYRQNDVSCLRGFIQDYDPEFVSTIDRAGTSADIGGDAHRALYDIQKSIAQMRLIRKYLEG